MVGELFHANDLNETQLYIVIIDRRTQNITLLAHRVTVYTEYQGNRKVIPVVSLKKKFKLPENEITELTRLIVINNGDRRIGFVVDDPSEVIIISEDDIEEAPLMIVGADRKYIHGVGKVDKRILIILDLHKLLTESKENQIRNIH